MTRDEEFGSVARGDDGPDSDLDFLVVVPDDIAPEKLRRGGARKAVQGTEHAKDVVTSAWEMASLPATAVREGRMLYDAQWRQVNEPSANGCRRPPKT